MCRAGQQDLPPVPWTCDFINTPEGRLFRAYARQIHDRAPALLLINPLGEEAKSAFAVLNDLCRAAWRAGWSVGRFDILGMGDSEGDFSQAGPSDWLRDAHRATGDFLAKMQTERLVLLGLRIGGNIAARLASEPALAKSKIGALILWEPILDFAKYLRHLGWVNRDAQPDGSVDHYGWRMTQPCLDAMKGELSINPQVLHCPVFVSQITAHGRLTRDVEAFGAELPESSRLQAVAARPFWELIGQASCESLIQQTLDWLCQVHGVVATR